MKNKSFGLWFILIILLSSISYTAYKIFNNHTYNIKFDVAGGSHVASLKVKEDTTITTLPSSIKDGYEFVGWYLNDELYDLNIPITKDITLTAAWKKNETQEYIISFATLSPEEISPLKVLSGATINELPIPKKEGYEFLGWYYHNKKIDLKKPITSNLTLVAKWQKINE